MTRTVAEAVSDLSSPDSIVRDQALGLLVSYGTRATAALLPLLDDDALRPRAARALGYIADPTTADRLAGLLADADPLVRSHAAYGLYQMKDPRAVEALIQTIDDFPVPTMYPATQSTDALRTLGAAVLPRVADLLTAPSADTRARARLVIVQIAGDLPPDEAAAWRARIATTDDPRS